MDITEELVTGLSNRINTERSKKDYTYVPPYDIKKSIEVFLEWLRDNSYEIVKRGAE